MTDLITKLRSYHPTSAYSTTMRQAADEIERLRNLIHEHNAGMEAECEWVIHYGRCDGYIERGRKCPDCSCDKKIDLDVV